jgi:hypothetical protein
LSAAATTAADQKIQGFVYHLLKSEGEDPIILLPSTHYTTTLFRTQPVIARWPLAWHTTPPELSFYSNYKLSELKSREEEAGMKGENNNPPIPFPQVAHKSKEELMQHKSIKKELQEDARNHDELQ